MRWVRLVARTIGVLAAIVAGVVAAGQVPGGWPKKALIGLVVALGLFLLWLVLGTGRFLLVLIGLALAGGSSFFLLVWGIKRLASLHLFVVTKVEATARIIIRGGAYDKILVHWRGRVLDREGSVVEGERHPKLLDIFGVEYYGIWPLVSVGSITIRWWNLHQAEGAQWVPVFHEEEQNWVVIRPNTYLVRIEKAETKPPERIPLTVDFLVTMRAVNPAKAVFDAPYNWTEVTTVRLAALFQDWIGRKAMDDLPGIRENPDALWQEFAGDPLIREVFLQQWGVLVEERGIEIQNITPSEEHQRAMAAQRIKELEAMGERRRIEIVYGAIQELGDLARLIRTLEAVERSPLAASMVVQAVPGLSEVLRGVFGAGPEWLTKDDIQNLRQAIEELSKGMPVGQRVQLSFVRRLLRRLL